MQVKLAEIFFTAFLLVSQSFDAAFQEFEADPFGAYELATDLFFFNQVLATSLVLSGLGDPFTDYSLTVQNGSDESVQIGFGFGIDIGVISVLPATTTFDITLTDENGDGASLMPTGAAIQTSFISEDRAILLDIPGLGVGGALMAGPNATALASFAAGPVDTPDPGLNGAAEWNVMGVNAFFTLSPFDSVTLEGRTVVPEPGTGSLGALGLAFLAYRTWRRRRTPNQ